MRRCQTNSTAPLDTTWAQLCSVSSVLSRDLTAPAATPLVFGARRPPISNGTQDTAICPSRPPLLFAIAPLRTVSLTVTLVPPAGTHRTLGGPSRRGSDVRMSATSAGCKLQVCLCPVSSPEHPQTATARWDRRTCPLRDTPLLGGSQDGQEGNGGWTETPTCCFSHIKENQKPKPEHWKPGAV